PDRVRVAFLLPNDAGSCGSGGDAAVWQEAEDAAGGARRGGSRGVVGDRQAWARADTADDGVCVRVADQRAVGAAGDGHRQRADGGECASGQGSEGSSGAVVGASAWRVADVVVWSSHQAVAVPWADGRVAAEADERDERAADGEADRGACA